MRSTRSKTHPAIPSPVLLLQALETSTWSEDRLAALRYALQDPHGNEIQAETAGQAEVQDADEEEEEEAQRINPREIYPFLGSVKKFFEGIKSRLRGPGNLT
jgi:hypothetical protein